MKSSESRPHKMVAFRCPQDLLGRLDERAVSSGVSRTKLLVGAIQLLVDVCKSRGGNITPRIRSSFARREINYVKELKARKDREDALEN